jgi:anthranilate phosphoribosyltransferase
VQTFYVHPADFGVPKAPADALHGGSAADNAAVVRRVLAGEPGPARDVVAMNAAAALFVAGAVESLRAGVRRAEQALSDGSAGQTLDRLVAASQAPAGEPV